MKIAKITWSLIFLEGPFVYVITGALLFISFHMFAVF